MKFLRTHSIFTWIMIGLSATLLLVSLPSGQHFCSTDGCGIMYWGAHEHDGIWHLAVISTLLDHFPFQLPNMSGAPLQGYNYLLDLILALFAKMSFLPATTWYFLIMPILAWGAMVGATLSFARAYRPSKTFPAWLLFFTVFGSSLGFVLSWLHGRGLSGASSLLLMQPLQYPLNPQLFLSLILLYPYLLFLSKPRPSRWNPLITAGYLFLFFGLKFYTGVIALILWIFQTIWDGVRVRHIPLLATLGVGIGTASAYFLFYRAESHTGFPLLFKPFATVNPIVEDAQLLYNQVLANRLYLPHTWMWYLLEIFVLSLFLILNFGSRILATSGLALRETAVSTTHGLRRLLIVGLTTGVLLTILFVQRGVWWNTVQFTYVSFFLFGIIAAEGMDRLWTARTWWSRSLVVSIVLLTIPTNLDVLSTFGQFPGTSMIPDAEIAALRFLKTQPRGTVFVPRYTQSPTSSRILHAQYDTAFIPAYTGHPTYLSDLVQLDLTGTQYQERLNRMDRLDCTVLSDVTYLYETSDNLYIQAFERCPFAFTQIFTNTSVTIYQVQNSSR